MSFLDNGLIKIGVALDRGGSIGYLADVKKGNNVVNVHDLGRWIGQSYYAGPKPFGEPHPAWKDWPWNPVSAGDVHGNAGKLLDHHNDGKTLYVKARPMQWALKNVPADCTFETWITLDGRTVHVRHRLTNERKDEKQYPAMDQELPAVYTIGTLHRLFTYDGDQPFTQAPLREVPNCPQRTAGRNGQPSQRMNIGRHSSMTTIGAWASFIPESTASSAVSPARRTRAGRLMPRPATWLRCGGKSSITTSSTNSATS
jgi:hypothetical protein